MVNTGFMLIKERLKAIRTALNLSQRDFAKGIPIAQSSLNRMEKGIFKVNPRMIELVCAKYGVNREYLKSGKGEMFGETPPDALLQQLELIYNDLNGLFREYLMVQAKELLNFQKKNEKQGGEKGQ